MNTIHINGKYAKVISQLAWKPIITNSMKDTIILENMDIFAFRKVVMILRENNNIKHLKCIGLTLEYELLCFLERIAQESTLESIEFHNFSTKNLLKTIDELRKYFPDFFAGLVLKGNQRGYPLKN